MTGSKRQSVPGLYIHIPFCVSKCDYCNFYSVTDCSKIPIFIECLLNEIELYKNYFDRFDTVYLGGGTPSILNPKQLGIILDEVHKYFLILEDAEITCEVNPGDLSLNYLHSLHDMGINRLSIGVQSFDDDLLTFLGRRHSASEAMNALDNSRKAGFENIGFDLIYGIPGQNLKSWEKDLHQALSFESEHISCYELTLEGDTPLAFKYTNGDISLPDNEMLYKLFIETSEFLEDAGYIHYEVSNFARNINLQSRHNQKYWDHTSYLGIGPAAHSFLKNKRWWNHRSLDHYTGDVKERRPPIGGREGLTLKQLRDEALYLGLRTRKGIHLKDFLMRYNCDLLREKKEIIKRLTEDHLIEIHNGTLQPTVKGLALADSIYREL